MKHHNYRFLASGILLLVGCSLDKERSVSLTLVPQVNGGCTVQAEVAPWSPADVKGFKVELYTVANGMESPVLSNGATVSVTMANAEFPVIFNHLHPNTAYRAKAYAYCEVGYLASSKISDDASSSLDILIGYETRPTVAKLPVQLVSKVFRGSGDNGISITNGTLLQPSTPITYEPLP